MYALSLQGLVYQHPGRFLHHFIPCWFAFTLRKVAHVIVSRPALRKCVDRDIPCFRFFLFHHVLFFLFKTGVANALKLSLTS